MLSTNSNGNYTNKQQLMALQEMFMQNVTHELRTPLTIIMGFAEIMASGDFGQLNSEQTMALDHIQRNTLTLKQLLERLEILLAVEAKQTHLAPLSLHALVTEIITLFWPHITEAQQTMAFYADEEIPMIWADSTHLQQAIICLLENAIKFTPAGGHITLRLYNEPGWACLAIQDTGIGIPPAELQTIFTRFYQVDGSTKRRYGGLGIGLALTNDVIRSQGGQIEVSSQVDQGSNFTLKLPLTPKLAESSPTTPPTSMKKWLNRVTNGFYWLTRPVLHLNR